jgi:hypothetical protein
MQMMGEKLRKIENKHKEERGALLDIIQKNVINNNAVQVINEKERRRQAVKERIKRLKKKLGEDEDLLNQISDYNLTANRSHIEIPKKPITPLLQTDYLSVLNKNDPITNALISLKNDMTVKFHEQSLKNEEKFSEINLNFSTFKREIMSKFEFMDHRHKLYSETLRYIMDNAGVPRLQKLNKKVFDGENIDLQEKEGEEQQKLVHQISMISPANVFKKLKF